MMSQRTFLVLALALLASSLANGGSVRAAAAVVLSPRDGAAAAPSLEAGAAAHGPTRRMLGTDGEDGTISLGTLLDRAQNLLGAAGDALGALLVPGSSAGSDSGGSGEPVDDSGSAASPAPSAASTTTASTTAATSSAAATDDKKSSKKDDDKGKKKDDDGEKEGSAADDDDDTPKASDDSASASSPRPSSSSPARSPSTASPSPPPPRSPSPSPPPLPVLVKKLPAVTTAATEAADREGASVVTVDMVLRAASLADAEAKGWGRTIRAVLASLVGGGAMDEWAVAPSAAKSGAAATAPRRFLLQQPQPQQLSLQWTRVSATPSLDAWRLGQPAPAGSLCGTLLCAALLAAGVDLDASAPVTVRPDPTDDLTAMRAAVQLQRARAAEAAADAAARQRRVGAIVGAAVGGFFGLLLLAAVAPKAWRAARAARAKRAAAQLQRQQQGALGAAAAAAVSAAGIESKAGKAGKAALPGSPPAKRTSDGGASSASSGPTIIAALHGGGRDQDRSPSHHHHHHHHAHDGKSLRF